MRAKIKFAVGDVVRIKTEAKSKVASATRAYAQQFKGEYFRVYRINRTLAVPMYYIQSMDTDEYIEGGFYAQELQRQRGDSFKVERVLRRRRRTNGRGWEILVKWQHFGPRWNSWIPETNVVRRYRGR